MRHHGDACDARPWTSASLTITSGAFATRKVESRNDTPLAWKTCMPVWASIVTRSNTIFNQPTAIARRLHTDARGRAVERDVSCIAATFTWSPEPVSGHAHHARAKNA